MNNEKNQKANLLVSLKRTLVPIIVGAVTASFLGPWVTDTQALRDLLASIIAGCYYTAVRFIEVRWPQAGILLGVPAQPDYKQNP